MPAGSWSATWLVALALAAALIGVCEYEARTHHQRPSVVDDASSWALMRREVEGDPNVVAFVGGSRTAIGFSAETFADEAPGARGVQLGIDGTIPFTILNDLAQDPDFKGVLVLDLIERDITAADVFHFPDTAPFLDRYHHLWRAPGAVANRYLAGWVQSALAVLAIKGYRLLPAWFGHGAWPQPTWVAMDRDRIQRADYSIAEADALAHKRQNRLRTVERFNDSPEHWMATVQRQLEPLFRQIRAHGGDVVVIHMPVTGEYGAAMDRKYPRDAYWDVFARQSTAHVWHYRDLPEMASLVCGDDMHLEEKDQIIYTRALADELRARHVLRTP